MCVRACVRACACACVACVCVWSVVALRGRTGLDACTGKLDVKGYLTRNNLALPNAATIMLGDNDLSGTYTDALTDAKIVEMVPQLRLLVENLHAAGVTAVGLVWAPPPGSQDGFGENYGVMQNTG